VVDPGGGSWYLEWLTDRIARAAWRRFQSIEADGGMAAALLDGAVAAELDRLRSARENAIATGRDRITGVSSYPDLAEQAIDRESATLPKPSETDPDPGQLARLFRATRTPVGSGTVVEAAVAAAAAGAGIGRLAAALRGTGEPDRHTPLPQRRDAAIYERLRDASDAHAAAHGSRPRIFLANMGPASEHRARSAFAINFFEAGGIEAVSNDGFATVAAAVDGFVAAATDLAVICASDERYQEMVPDLASALDERGARTVLLAGRPGDDETAWRAAGITGFVYVGCDQLRILVDLLREEGVLHV
jgi:methylmalonyl-CoA mutase